MELDCATLSPDELVNKLWDKRIRNQVIRALTGGLTATEWRRVRLTPEARGALSKGLEHSSSKVRWWCLQIIDHVGDELCLERVPPLLEDAVPKVRKLARHTLACVGCKQSPELAAAGRRLLAESERQA